MEKVLIIIQSYGKLGKIDWAIFQLFTGRGWTGFALELLRSFSSILPKINVLTGRMKRVFLLRDAGLTPPNDQMAGPRVTSGTSLCHNDEVRRQLRLVTDLYQITRHA